MVKFLYYALLSSPNPHSLVAVTEDPGGASEPVGPRGGPSAGRDLL